MTTEERFWAKVVKTDTCWIWKACTVRNYGQFGSGNRKRVKAHRFSYELVNGPIQEGLQIDHLCRNTLCVNPSHLEAVTPRINTLRSNAPTAKNAAKTTCKNGHPLIGPGAKVYFRDRNGHIERHCRICTRDAIRAWRAKVGQ